MLRRALFTLVCLLFAIRVDATQYTVCAQNCVATNSQLTTILNNVVDGDEVLLEWAITYTGPEWGFVMRDRCATPTWNCITIRTGVGSTGTILSESFFPPDGVRLTTGQHGTFNYRPFLATLKPGVNNSPAIRTVWPGETGNGCTVAPCVANGWTLKWLSFAPKDNWFARPMIHLGTNRTPTDTDFTGHDDQDTVAEAPGFLSLLYSDIHGDPVRGQSGGIRLSSASTRIIGNSFTDIKSNNDEVQAINECNGVGPFLIENNLIQATGENVMFGGCDSHMKQVGIMTGTPTSTVFTLDNVTELYANEYASVTVGSTTYSGAEVLSIVGNVVTLKEALPVTPSAGDRMNWARIAGGITFRLNHVEKPAAWFGAILPTPTLSTVTASVTGGTLSGGGGAVPTRNNAGSVGSANASSVNFSLTVGGLNRYLVCGVATQLTTRTASSVTFNGVALTRLDSLDNDDDPNRQSRVELWELVAPPATTANVVATLNASTSVSVGCVAWENIDQSTPHGSLVSAKGDGANVSLDVPSASSEVVMDIASIRVGTTPIVPGDNQTQQVNKVSGSGFGNVSLGMSSQAGASTTTMGWTVEDGTPKAWTILGISLKGTSAGGGIQYCYRLSTRMPGTTNTTIRSAASTEMCSTVAAGSTGSVVVTWPAEVNATVYRIYGRASNSATQYWDVAAGTLTFTDDGTAGTAEVAPNSGTVYVVKNNFEFKHAEGAAPAGVILLEGNVFDGSWCCSQNMIVNMKGWNQNGGDVSAAVRNVTFRKNWIRHGVRGLALVSNDSELHPTGRMANVVIEDVLFTDLSTAWGGDFSAVYITTGNPTPYIGSRGVKGVTFNHLTFVSSDTTPPAGTIWFDKTVGHEHSDITITNSIFPKNGTYGFQGLLSGGLRGGAFQGTNGWNDDVVGTSTAHHNVWPDSVSGTYSFSTSSFFPTESALRSAYVNHTACLADVITGCALTGASAYDNAASDGRDIGADIAAIKVLTDQALSGDTRSGVDEPPRPRFRFRIRGI